MNVSQKVITGDWDGEPIWRYKTAEEVLFEALSEQQKERLI